MKKIIATIVLGLSLLSFGCTENQRARNFGGASRIEVPANEKLVVLTWKDDDLWILTRARKAGETAETYTFREDSSFGIVQGTVTVVER